MGVNEARGEGKQRRKKDKRGMCCKKKIMEVFGIRTKKQDHLNRSG